MYRSVMESLREHLMDVGEPRQLVLPCPGCGDNRVIMARQVTKEEVESNPIFAEFRERSRASTPQIEELRRNSRYNFTLLNIITRNCLKLIQTLYTKETLFDT